MTFDTLNKLKIHTSMMWKTPYRSPTSKSRHGHNYRDKHIAMFFINSTEVYRTFSNENWFIIVPYMVFVGGKRVDDVILE